MTERADYFSFENCADMVAYTLVCICQTYYFFTGKMVGGYFFPDEESHFEDFLLLAILLLHLNLIVQYMIAFSFTRQYIIMIIETVKKTS